MKRAGIAVITLFFSFSCFAKQPEQPIAFVGAKVIPMTSDAVLTNQTVVVSGDRILAIGDVKKVVIPKNARRIDAKGKFLLPGLAEMHGHIPTPTADRKDIDAVLFLYLAGGITTVRGMLGHPGQLDLRADANSGKIDSPTLYLAGPSFNGQSINSAEEAVEKVKQQKKEGWDLLKVHPGLDRAEYDAMASTARDLGIRFGGHVPEKVGLEHAIDMGQETFDHLDGYIEYLEGDKGPLDPVKLGSILDKTKKAKAWVVPTMALWEVLFGTLPLRELQSYDELRYVKPQVVDQWVNAHNARRAATQFDPEVARRVIDNRQKLLGAMNQSGVRILMGTDAPQQFSVPGFSLHRELQRMSAAGMTPYQILVTGTRNVGEYFKTSDSFGTLERGKRADIMLVDANPLEDIMNLQKLSGVMARGRWYSKEDIAKKLAEIEKQVRP